MIHAEIKALESAVNIVVATTTTAALGRVENKRKALHFHTFSGADTTESPLIHLLNVTSRQWMSKCPSDQKSGCSRTRSVNSVRCFVSAAGVHYLIDMLIVSHCDSILCALSGEGVRQFRPGRGAGLSAVRPTAERTDKCLLKSWSTATTHQNNAQQFVVEHVE